MNIVIVNGQNHKGTTYQIGRMLAEKIGGDITEFFLPKDFGHFCTGCSSCIMKSEELCPHHNELEKITNAMDNAELLIFTTPVYVYHSTGSMKAFLDHYGYRWMIHRPEPKMFSKQAVCIASAAGAGMKWAIKDIADSTYFWGIPKTYKFGIAVHAISYSHLNDKTKDKINKKTDALAKKIKKQSSHIRVGIKTKGFFYISRMLQKKDFNNGTDKKYWDKYGWCEKERPWKS